MTFPQGKQEQKELNALRSGHGQARLGILHTVQAKYEEPYREILACYCELQGGKRTLHAAYTRSKRGGRIVGPMPAFDTVQLWFTGNRSVDGFPLAVFSWPEIARMVDSGALQPSAIRATGHLVSKVRDILYLALADSEFVARLLRKPELLLSLWNKALETDRMPRVLEDVVAKHLMELREAAGQPTGKITTTGLHADVEEHKTVGEMSDEDLEALLGEPEDED